MSEFGTVKPEKDKSIAIIERAKPEDAKAILTLKRDAWLSAYVSDEHAVTREDIYKKLTDEDIEKAAAEWGQGIAEETEDGERITFVARLDGKVVGYTQPCVEDGQRRLGAMYVSPEVQGHGIGAKLIAKALERQGSNDVYAHVVSYNDKAIRFYERFGFERTGKEFPEEFDEELGIKLLPEIEMVHKANVNS